MVAIMKLKTISAFIISLVIATGVFAAPKKNMASAMLRSLSRTFPKAFAYTNKSSRYLPPNMPPSVYEQMQKDRRTGKLTEVNLADLQLQPPWANSARIQKPKESEQPDDQIWAPLALAIILILWPIALLFKRLFQRNGGTR